MTQAIESPRRADEAPRTRLELPTLPTWVLPRPRLADRLDLGACGLLTSVTGAAGSGKTMAVASWARGADLPGRLIWMSLAGIASDPGPFWELMRDALHQAGERHLAPIPVVGSHERRRLHALTVWSMALRRAGPWTLVLDDFPTGQVERLGRELEVVMDHAQRQLRLVVISRGEPAINVQRHHVAGDLTRVEDADLALDAREVAGVLARHGVVASALTARAVERHTNGWPCGVHLAAVALRDAPTVEVALAAADRGAVDYLTSEVLGKAAPRDREVITRTSWLDEVSPSLAQAILASEEEVRLGPEFASSAGVELGQGGGFRCPPLVRAAALTELEQAPEVVRESRQRAAQWYVDQGDVGAGLSLAREMEDWAWAGRTLVESYAVPRILAGSAGEVAESALAVAAVTDAEPMLRAAMALRHGDLDASVPAITGAAGSAGGQPRTADRIAVLFIGVYAARLRGDATTGLALATELRELVAELPTELHDELVVMVDAHEGAIRLGIGEVHQAAVVLQHGATSPPVKGERDPARIECRGQLALLEAFQGNLRVSERIAAEVLSDTVTAPGPGVALALLARAWVLLERAEPKPARRSLDRAVEAGLDGQGPWPTVARTLVEARLLTLAGQPEAALRLLTPAMLRERGREPGWLLDLLTLGSAESQLAGDEPRRALAAVTRGLAASPVEGGVLAACALLDLGEVDAARAALAAVIDDLEGSNLDVQVECWLVEARVARLDGHPERVRVLVDRALRTSGAESLRRPFVHRSAWLSELIDCDPRLRRTHGELLGGSRTVREPGKPGVARSGPVYIAALTSREGEVLQLLAQMWSTEEIALELFLSVNTIKTHVRGILRKLGVSRRVDAVRRGRELGLC